MLKASEPIFVNVNTHILNKIPRFMYTNNDKIVWGNNLYWEGKAVV
jgi:hypothetical protein